jgi:hypothetical protein
MTNTTGYQITKTQFTFTLIVMLNIVISVVTKLTKRRLMHEIKSRTYYTSTNVVVICNVVSV